MEKVTLTIKSGDRLQEPAVLEGITWETTRKGEPSKLTFTVIKDENLSFSEGAEVVLHYGDTQVFHGFVFEKSRNKDQHISVVAYDQLRYLKYKVSYRKTAGARLDQVVKQLADDFRLKTGSLVNTKFTVPKIDERNQTLFDIIQYAIDETVMNTGELYYLYDDCGKLTLKNIKDSCIDFMINKDTAEDFDYKSSIDSNTYNRVIIVEGNEDDGGVVRGTADDLENIGKWGVLQYFENGYKGDNPQKKADVLLKAYNQVFRSLTIRGCSGDIRVRAGCGVYLDLYLGDIHPKTRMLVERATHTFDKDHHYMDLELRGAKEFYDK